MGIAALVLGYRALRSESDPRLRTERDELRRKIAERRKVADGID